MSCIKVSPFKLSWFLLFSIFSYQENQLQVMKVVVCDENRTAQCATVPDKTNIRIRNISEYEFCNVE